MRKHIITIILIAGWIGTYAQLVVQPEEHTLSILMNPWTQIQNAAGLGLSSVVTHGVTELGYDISNGDYHRAQEGNARNGLNFYSERYDKLGKNWLVWGSFNFIMDREENRCWSDAFTTYNNNPYLYGSSIPGNYDRQLFDFHAKISRQAKGKINYGFGIDYQVGDLSRLRDPRTRVYLADYAAIPSITFSINQQQTIGLNLSARYQKEKMPNITTVQDDPNLKYYSFLGMENADAVIGGFTGFQRQFVSSFYGFDLQYAYSTEKMKLLLSGGAFLQNQQILENIKQSPGSFNSMNYKGTVVLSSALDKLLLNTSLKGNFKQGSANENLQELVTVRDTATGIASQSWVTLFTYNSRYINNTYDLKLNIDLRDLSQDKKDYSWMGGLEMGISGFKNQYFLPFSEMAVNRANGGIYGHYRIFNKNDKRITLKGNLNYEFHFNNKLTLSNGTLDAPTLGASTFKNGTYDVATNVIMPDYQFYQLNAISFKIEANYTFLLSFKKTKMAAFTKLYYKNTITDSNSYHSWMNAGISFGIIPL